MASICASLPSQLITHRRHCPSSTPQIPSFAFLKLSSCLANLTSTSRLQNVMGLQSKGKSFVAYSASNSNPSGGESSKDKSVETSSDAAKGPPFLTIVAGFLVFFCIFWVFKSIFLWLFGLIVPASK